MLSYRIESIAAAESLAIVRVPELLATSGRAIAPESTPSKWASFYIRSIGSSWTEVVAIEMIRENGYRLKLADLFSALAPGGEFFLAPGDEIGVGVSPALGGSDFASARFSWELAQDESPLLAELEAKLLELSGKVDTLTAAVNAANAIASSSVETSVSVGTTSTTAIAANSNRLSVILTNTSTTAVAYLRSGPEAAAAALYSYSLAPGQFIELAIKEAVQAIGSAPLTLIVSEQLR